MFDVLVNGHKTADYSNIWVANIPQIQSSTTERDKNTIPQRDGDISSRYYRRTSAFITVTFHALNILSNKRVITSVFCNQVNEKLRLQNTFPTISIIDRVNGIDSYDSYFNIRNATIVEEMSKDDKYGRVTIQYEIEPFEYMLDDTEVVYDKTLTTQTLTVINGGDTCKPIYTFETTSSTSYTVAIKIDSNSNIEYGTFNSSGKWVSDTEKMMTYKMNSSMDESKFITGDYQALWIPSGTHDIKVTTNAAGIQVKIQMRRGYDT